MTKTRVHFFGDGLWAYNSLKELLENNLYEVVAIILRSKPDVSIKDFSEERGIYTISPTNINMLDFNTLPRADMGISVSYDQIFKQQIISRYENGMINLHASSLPDYKGRNVLNWALINGERKIHLTVHWIDQGIDTGPIIHQHELRIGRNETYHELLERCYEEAPEALVEALLKIKVKNKSPLIHNQAKKLPILCTKRVSGDEIINWEWNSLRIHNFVRALSIDNLYARTYILGEEVKIKKTEYLKNAPEYIDICGSVLAKENNSIIVKTGDSYIKIVEWEADSKIRCGFRFANK